MAVVNPFDALRDRLQAVLVDVRYAQAQLTRHRDVSRAMDALDRVVDGLVDELETPPTWTEAPGYPSDLDVRCATCGCQLDGPEIEAGVCAKHADDEALPLVVRAIMRGVR
jgi:hypothetical protein